MSKNTPGPWRAECRHVGYKGGEWSRDEFLQWEVVGPEVPHGRGDFYQADARLIAAAPDLLEACQTFAEWLRREDAGFDHKTHNRETPEGEAAWRDWFYGNIALCDLAQEKVRAAIAKATGEQS